MANNSKQIECPRCSGSGVYTNGGVCYRCKGMGRCHPVPARKAQPKRTPGTPSQEWNRLVDSMGLADACTLAAVNADYVEFRPFARAAWKLLTRAQQAHIRSLLA